MIDRLKPRFKREHVEVTEIHIPVERTAESVVSLLRDTTILCS